MINSTLVVEIQVFDWTFTSNAMMDTTWTTSQTKSTPVGFILDSLIYEST